MATYVTMLQVHKTTRCLLVERCLCIILRCASPLCVNTVYKKLHNNNNNNNNIVVKTFSLPTNAHNVKKHRVIKTF